MPAYPFGEYHPLYLISAGQQDTPDYVRRVQELNWQRWFEEYELGTVLEELRTEWTENFDFVLIDSRTGITDIGGVCTILMPDILVVLFTTNLQSFEGVRDVVQRAKEARAGCLEIAAILLPCRCRHEMRHAPNTRKRCSGGKSYRLRWIRFIGNGFLTRHKAATKQSRVH